MRCVNAIAPIEDARTEHEKSPHAGGLSHYFAYTRSKHVHDDPANCKPREECIPFTYRFLQYGEDPEYGVVGRGRRLNGAQALKAQESFVKKLSVLEKKIAREHKARAKRSAS